jgi:hypothetical protein
MSDDSIEAQGSQGLVNKPQGTVEQQFGDRTEANTGGGDMAQRDIDKRNITIHQNITIHTGSADTKSPNKIAELSQINNGVGLKVSSQDNLNPFQYGAPVSPDRFYGRVSAIADVKNRIGAISAQCVNIVGLRRSGKSSFLRYIKERPQVFFQDSQQPLIVSLDLQNSKFHDHYGLMEGLRRGIKAQVGTAPWGRDDNIW